MSGNEFMAEMAAFLRPGGAEAESGASRDVTTALKLKKSKKEKKSKKSKRKDDSGNEGEWVVAEEKKSTTERNIAGCD